MQAYFSGGNSRELCAIGKGPAHRAHLPEHNNRVLISCRGRATGCCSKRTQRLFPLSPHVSPAKSIIVCLHLEGGSRRVSTSTGLSPDEALEGGSRRVSTSTSKSPFFYLGRDHSPHFYPGESPEGLNLDRFIVVCVS